MPVVDEIEKEVYPRSKKPKKNPGVDKAAAARQKRVEEMKAKPINDEIAQFANRYVMSSIKYPWALWKSFRIFVCIGCQFDNHFVAIVASITI